MKSSRSIGIGEEQTQEFPGTAALAVLRAWYAGMSSSQAVAQYLGQDKASGQSARAMLGDIRRQLARHARMRHRDDLAQLLMHPGAEREKRARAVMHAIEAMRHLPAPRPLVTDEIGRWLPLRTANALRAHGIRTLADLTVRVPRRRRWWASIPGLGATGAKQVETFFAAHPELTERARALVPAIAQGDVAPWERLCVPHQVDRCV